MKIFKIIYNILTYPRRRYEDKMSSMIGDYLLGKIHQYYNKPITYVHVVKEEDEQEISDNTICVYRLVDRDEKNIREQS